MKKAIQFGCGNIGRGFMGALLSQAGYQLVFCDVVQEVIDRINEAGEYTVHVKDVESYDIPVKNVKAVNSTTPAAVDEIADADILTTAVNKVNLPRIAPVIAAALEKRREIGCNKPINLICCENGIGVTTELKGYVYEHLSEETKAFADEYAGFPNCAVDRMCPTLKLDNPVDVVVEKYCEWDVERADIKGEIPEIDGMTVVDSLDAYLERKLFTLNTAHCITAYLGTLKGLPTIEKSLEDEEIHDTVLAAMKESGAGLVKKHGFDPEKHAAYIEMILGRFNNPHLKDDVRRVGREPLRKLSPADRLIKPLMTAAGFGLPVDHLIIGIAAALHYKNPEDPQAVELQERIAESGVRAVFSEVSGVTDEKILDAVVEQYEKLA